MADSTKEIYYNFHDLKKEWKRLYENSSQMQRKVEEYLNLDFLFGDGKDSNHLEFVTAVSKKNGKHYLLLTYDSVANLQSQLSNKLKLQKPLPLPNGYTDVETQPININNTKEFFKASDVVKKANKAAVAAARITEINRSYAEAKKALHDGHYVFLSLDVESYERDHDKLTEIGWTLLDPRHSTGERKLLDQHYIIREFVHLRNRDFVVDYKDNFRFGTSVTASLEDSVKELQKDIELYIERDGGIYLIGHDLKADIDYMEKAGIQWPQTGTIVRFDTVDLNAARLGNPNEKMGLGRALDALDIDNWCLHNAGNDAHYTMELFLRLCDDTTSATPITT